MTLEFATCLSIGSGFMDQQEGSGQKKGKVLFIASDGGASAWALVNDYCDALQTVNAVPTLKFGQKIQKQERRLGTSACPTLSGWRNGWPRAIWWR
jgi:hypothetical protein